MFDTFSNTNTHIHMHIIFTKARSFMKADLLFSACNANATQLYEVLIASRANAYVSLMKSQSNRILLNHNSIHLTIPQFQIPT